MKTLSFPFPFPKTGTGKLRSLINTTTTISPQFCFSFFGNPEILFYLATLHRLNWFVVAAANV
jgi:hypothetical protein